MNTKQDNIIRTDYAEIMQKSYIDYAMSVIIAALILRQTITAVAVIGVIVVSLAGALLVWSSGGDAVNG